MKRVALSLLLLSGMSWMSAHADMPRLGDGFDPALTNFSRLAFWVDANANCITNAEGAVTQWADVREVFADGIPTTEHTFAYNRGRVHLPAEGSTDIPGTPPTFKTDDRHPGLKFLDFGDYGSGRWMYLANPAGNHFRQNVGTFYCVLGFNTSNNSGHILSDIKALNLNKGVAFFHKQSGGSAAGCISSSDANASSMLLGATYLDGVRINPSRTYYKWPDYQMLGQVGPCLSTYMNESLNVVSTPIQPYFSTLLNDRNAVLDKNATPVTYRQGGAVIGELLVWNDVLTEEERCHVEAYLRAKWFGLATTKATALATGEMLVVDNGAKASFVEAATGDGTLVKRGSGTTTLARHMGGGSATIQLEEGALVVAGGRMDEVPVKPVPGTKITLSEGGAVASALPSASVAEITGLTATVRPADLANKTLVAADTQIRVAPTPASVYGGGNLLQNASFENGIEGWTVSNERAGTAEKGDAFYNGIGTLDGTKFLYLQAQVNGTSRMLAQATQMFTAPIDGLYRLTFKMARRTGDATADGDLVAYFFIDDTWFYKNFVAADHRGSDVNEFKLYSAYLPPLKKGTSYVLKLTFENSTTTQDGALLLDDLRLTPLAAGEYVFVPNAGMDSSSAAARLDGGNGWWNTGGLAGWRRDGSAGFTEASTMWSWKNSVETLILRDYRKAWLSNVGTMWTQVTIPRDGRIRLSFTYANRSNSGWNSAGVGTARATGHWVVASLSNDVENVQVATATPLVPTLQRCEGVCDVKAGTYDLRFFCDAPDGTASGACTAVLDDVLINYEDTSWTWSGDVQKSYDEEALTDEIQIPCGAWAQRTVTVPSNGLYRVALTMSGRKTAVEEFNGVTLGVNYYPVRLAVTVDGEQQAIYRLQDDTLRTMGFALPYLTEGDHTVRITTLEDGSAAQAMVRVTDVAVHPLEAATPPAKEVTQETRLRLTDGAKLDLVYEGKMYVSEFSVDGTRHMGTLSHETTGLANVLTGPGEIVVVPRGTVLLLR